MVHKLKLNLSTVLWPTECSSCIAWTLHFLYTSRILLGFWIKPPFTGDIVVGPLCSLFGMVGEGTGTLSLTYNGFCLACLPGGEGSLFVPFPNSIKPKNGQWFRYSINGFLILWLPLRMTLHKKGIGSVSRLIILCTTVVCTIRKNMYKVRNLPCGFYLIWPSTRGYGIKESKSKLYF